MQALFDYGDVVWEGEPFVPSGNAAKVAGFAQELEALRRIFTVNERGQFEFVVTEANLREVMARGSAGYTQWVHDLLDTCLVQAAGERLRTPATSHQRPGSVSKKDWLLLADALALGCDAFLTMERRLASQADVIGRLTGLHVLRPRGYWTSWPLGRPSTTDAIEGRLEPRQATLASSGPLRVAVATAPIGDWI